MNTTQHTPGPWSYRAQNNGQFIVETPQKSICWLDRHYDPSESDAKLIAAAPELLLSLEQAVARVELANTDGNKILSAWLPEAKAAISKAKGGE